MRQGLVGFQGQDPLQQASQNELSLRQLLLASKTPERDNKCNY